jgi:hypothetical protein
VDEDGWGREACRGTRGEMKSGREASRGRAARAAVLNKVITFVITRLEGENEGVCAVHISEEDVEPTHHPGAK